MSKHCYMIGLAGWHHDLWPNKKKETTTFICTRGEIFLEKCHCRWLIGAQLLSWKVILAVWDVFNIVDAVRARSRSDTKHCIWTGTRVPSFIICNPMSYWYDLFVIMDVLHRTCFLLLLSAAKLCKFVYIETIPYLDQIN